jgi:hypothetical protein
MLADALESRGRQPGEDGEEEDDIIENRDFLAGGSGGNADPFYYEAFGEQMRFIR